MALTELQIKRAAVGDKPYDLRDGRGLFLVVTPGGGKLWRWKYRFERKEKLMSFGKYPDVSLSRARERHDAARKLLSEGFDPMAVKKAEKTALKEKTEHSFRNIGGLWLEHWRSDKSARHVDATRRRLEANVYPVIGSKCIAEIGVLELVAVVKQIEERAPDLAKRALETVGQIFRFAIAHGYASRNPTAEIRPRDILKPTRKINLARIDVKELPAFLRAIEVYRGKVLTRLATKLLALTFVRTSELIGARWSEFDLKAGRWDIPAERMKMRTPHIVPLSRQAREVLELLHSLTGGGDFVFPGDMDPKKPMSNNTILFALARMGYKGRQTGHGFRGLASTLLHEMGFPHDHIELQLAHAPRNAVAAAYNHALYLAPRAKMMQHWGDYLERTQRGGKVLPFKTDAA